MSENNPFQYANFITENCFLYYKNVQTLSLFNTIFLRELYELKTFWF